MTLNLISRLLNRRFQTLATVLLGGSLSCALPMALSAQNMGIDVLNPQAKLDVQGAAALKPTTVAAGGNVTIPNNYTTIIITAAAGGAATTLQAPAQATEGQYLTILNLDDQAATFAGVSIPATNGVNNYVYLNGVWRFISSTGASGGNTLDQAYDQGGPGAGRIITADAGPVEINGTGAVTANFGRLNVTTIGGTAGTPSSAISGYIYNAGSVGFGVTGEVVNNTNPGSGGYFGSNGTGQALQAVMTGTGSAGYFQNQNGAGNFAAIQALTNNPVEAIYAFNTNTTAAAAVGVYGQIPQTGAGFSGIYGENLRTNGGYGVAGISSASVAGAVTGGVQGQATGSNAHGVIGWNSLNNSIGCGVIGIGNGLPNSSNPTTGAGGAFTGQLLGAQGIARNTAAVEAAGGYFENDGAFAYVGGWQNGTTARKIWGPGTVNTIVKDLNNQPVTMTCPEAPEILLQDYGTGQLKNGRAHITIDPILSKNITVNEKHPLRVFIQLEGDCNGVYVTNKTATGFDVIELQNGKSNTPFVWNVTANRADEVYTRADGTIRISKNADDRFAPAKGAMPQIEQTIEAAPKRAPQTQTPIQPKKSENTGR